MSTPNTDPLAQLARRSMARLALDWNEGDHPRGESGKFGSGGSGASNSSAAGAGADERIAKLFSNSLGMKRADMPQVPAGYKAEFLNELKAKAPIKQEMVDARDLKPTQGEFKADQVEAMAKAGVDPDKGTIMVSSDGYVLDGHHRWAAAALNGTKLNTIRVGMSIKELLADAKDFNARAGVKARTLETPVNVASDAWAEADHPRADNGQFGAGGGGHGHPAPLPEGARAAQATLAPGAMSFLPPEVHNRAKQAIALYKRAEAPGRQLSATEKTKAAEELAPALKSAAADKPGYDANMEEIGKALGAKILLAPLKGGDRLLQKHVDENGSNPAEMKDLVRGSVIVKSLADVPKALEAIKGKFDVARVKDRFANPMDTGYQDMLINVRLPSGIMGEIQVHVPEMLAAKNDLGHDLYNVSRVMPDSHEAKAGLIALQKEVYGAARAAQERSTSKRLDPVASQDANSSRDKGSPSSPAFDGLPYTRETLVSKSNAVQVPSGSTTTGMPSTSKNRAFSGSAVASMAPILPLARVAMDRWNGGATCAARRAMDAWNEADHPRGEGGQFGAGSGGGSGKAPASKYHAAAGQADTLTKNAKSPDQHLAAANAHNIAAHHLGGEEFVGKQAAGQKHKAAVAHHLAEYGKGTQGGYQKVADLARAHSANAKTAEQHLQASLSHQAALEHLGRAEFVGKQAAGQEHRAKMAHHQAQYAALTGQADKNRQREDARAAGQAHDFMPPEIARRALTAWGAADADEHWITVHGGEGKGTPIKITAGGVVVGGAGGNLNGKVLTPKSKSAPIKGSSSGGESEGGASAKAEAVAKTLQNRNRSSAASITQMNRIASNPNPRLLMSAPTMNDGAPVVSDLGGKGIAKHTGRRDWVVTGKREIPVRYAIVEAGDLSVSNRADGTKNDDYAKDLDKLTAINNGRTAGVIEAYNRGTADAYKKALAKGERIHGIPASVVRKMERPVLVRVMDAADVDSQIGDESNSTMTLTLSAVEQAQNDAARFDPASIEYNEDGSPTDASVRGFINAMPQSEQQSLAPNGRPTRQAVDRMLAATFHAAYGDTELVGLMAQATDPESRNLIAGMSRAAGSMAKLKDAGELDIRELVTGAAKQIINAVRSGVSTKKFLKQGDLLTQSGEDAIAALFAENARSAKAIAEKLDSAASFAYSEASRAGVDMFGETIPTASREQVLEHLHA